MILAVKNALSTIAPKLTYDVLIENQADGTVKATLLSLPECQGLGNTETEAIEELDKILQVRLGNAKIVTLEIKSPQIENPWMKIAGKYKDDPHFDQMLEYIEEYRRELDANQD
jgi:predicted RNase H-like HicB family nuclease